MSVVYIVCCFDEGFIDRVYSSRAIAERRLAILGDPGYEIVTEEITENVNDPPYLCGECIRQLKTYAEVTNEF